jgi:hypothetical protein
MFGSLYSTLFSMLTRNTSCLFGTCPSSVRVLSYMCVQPTHDPFLKDCSLEWLMHFKRESIKQFYFYPETGFRPEFYFLLSGIKFHMHLIYGCNSRKSDAWMHIYSLLSNLSITNTNRSSISHKQTHGQHTVGLQTLTQTCYCCTKCRA